MYHIFAHTPIWRTAPEKLGHGNVLDRGDRPSPKESATLYDAGTSREGQDGKMWHIIVASNGTHRWAKGPGNHYADGADLDKEEDEDWEKSGMVPVTAKRIDLFFKEGTSDKEYHLQLSGGAGGKYMVNFQYGRRGSALKPGTKTPSPVSLEEAEKIYAKYVKEKTKEGYTEK
jgi:predicted DNA-binding WGR domain protein